MALRCRVNCGRFSSAGLPDTLARQAGRAEYHVEPLVGRSLAGRRSRAMMGPLMELMTKRASRPVKIEGEHTPRQPEERTGPGYRVEGDPETAIPREE